MSITRGQASGIATGANFGTLTWGTLPAAGSKVLVTAWSSSGETISSVKDNGTVQSTFTLDATESANGVTVWIYRADGISLPGAGSYTVTVTGSGGHNSPFGGIAYSGVKTGGPTATNVGTNAGGTSVTTNSVTPTAAGALFFGAFVDATALASETITLTGSGFTQQLVEVNGSTFWAGGAADKIDAGGPTATACTWTLGDTVAWSGAIAVYDAAPSVSPQSVVNIRQAVNRLSAY